MTWTDDALCREVGIELFFPPEEYGSADYTGARRICARCPVQDECLADAMDTEGTADRHNRHGLRAGLSPPQRHRLYLARQRGVAA